MTGWQWRPGLPLAPPRSEGPNSVAGCPADGDGTWYAGSEATFTLDLADLPPYVSFPTNILAELQDGELEFMVEDDTSVDYALLRICLCPVEVEPLTWGRLKAGYR